MLDVVVSVYMRVCGSESTYVRTFEQGSFPRKIGVGKGERQRRWSGDRGLVGSLCSWIVGGASRCAASCVKQKLSMEGIVGTPVRGGK